MCVCVCVYVHILFCEVIMISFICADIYLCVCGGGGGAAHFINWLVC